MSEPGTVLASVCLRLNAEAARYVLIGTRALQLWGIVAPGLDIQLLVEPTPANVERVLRGLRRAGCRFAREWLATEVANRQVTVLGQTPQVDILTVAAGVHFRHAVLAAHRFVIEGVTIPTASIEDLITIRQTGRRADAEQILLLEAIQRRTLG